MSSTASDRSTEPPIVLIHGMWMTPLSWEHWANRYRERGHQVLAPAWPGLEGEPEEIRRDPSPLQGLSITDVIDHYEKIIRGLDRPPIIIGHSFGGLYAQLLLNRGLGSAGAALGTGAPKGVLRLPYSTIRAAWTALHNPFGKNNVAPAHGEAVPLVLHELAQPRGLGRGLRALLHPRVRAPVLPGRLRELQPERSDEGRLPESERGRRSSWSRVPRTASARLRSTRRTSRSSARRRRPRSTRSTRAVVTTPARTAGKKSRTTFSPGRPGTRPPQRRTRSKRCG